MTSSSSQDSASDNLKKLIQDQIDLKSPFSKNKTRVLALGVLLLGFLFDVFFIHTAGHQAGLGVLLFQVVFLAFADRMFGASKNLAKKPVLTFAVIISLALAGWFAVFNTSTLTTIYALLLVIVDLFILLYISGYIQRDWHTIRIVRDYLDYVFQALGQMPLAVQATTRSYRGKTLGNKTTIKMILSSLLLLAVLLLLIVPLLMHSDSFFADAIGTIFAWFRFPDWEMGSFMGSLVVIAIASLFFLGLFYTAGHLSKGEDEGIKLQLFGIAKLRMGIILVGVNLVYLLYVAIQFKYLFFGSHDLIVSMGLESYAAYIHKGFYELILVACINFGIYFVFQRSAAVRAQKFSGVHGLLLVLILLTACMNVSALMRVVMYVQSYGLSELRIFVHYIIGFLLLSEGFLLYKLFVPRVSYLSFVFYSFLASFTFLGYLNMDKTIARHNLQHHNQVQKVSNNETLSMTSFRKSQQLDKRYLFNLSIDAIDEQLHLLKEDPETLSDMEYSAFFFRYEEMKQVKSIPWYHWNWYTNYTRKMLLDDESHEDVLKKYL